MSSSRVFLASTIAEVARIGKKNEKPSKNITPSISNYMSFDFFGIKFDRSFYSKFMQM